MLYLLFLVPLGAFASCPAGLKLSSVPISTELPYCVKWETSSLGGCEVACPGVCVEVPASGTKGPIETTGGECTLGGGGSGETGGGDNGGGNTGGAPYYYPFKDQISPIGVGGHDQEATTAALKQIDEDLRWTAIKLYGQGEASLATFKDFGRDLRKVTDALTTQINGSEQVGLINNQMLSTLNRSEDALRELTNCVVNPLANGCGHLTGSSSGAVSTVDLSAIKGDVASLKAMQQSAMSTLGSIGGNTSSMSSNIGNMLGAIGSLQGSVNSVNSNISSQSGYLSQMNDNLYGIKYMLQDGLKNGWGNSGGGQGGSGDFNIDYSQMPGSASNPMHIAKAEYESPLCSGDASCAFDLEQITKVYDEHKEALKSQYLSIKNEMTDMFKYQFYGSASVPKCFDMFSMYGKAYQVCPDADGYWEFLAALMMFIFYFVAFMIIAKR
ncbi:hypothetical protein [Aeromonas caviae]|uniref:hypothetical protein n=1 Tax=Aeromonas caviae TaxID=648 RepID=UPI002B45A44E|nr:hypothetical protein [Aeromonas caviae]